MARDNTIERVHERREAETLQHPAERCQHADLTHDGHAGAGVPAQRRPVAQHEPPAFSALVLGYGGEQGAGPLVIQWKDGERVMPVERGGDPRRPTT